MDERSSDQDICFIVKVTNNCNMGCSYCYYRRNMATGPQHRMTIDVLERTISDVLENNALGANFIWHGGEPLLMGREFFSKALEIERKTMKALHKDYPISNSVQTNGLCINEEWCDFFKANDFRVGISLDGPLELQSTNRGTTEKEFEKIVNGIDLLVSENVPVSILSVITSDTLGHEKDLFSFYSEHNIESVSFLPMNYGDLNTCLSSDYYAIFLQRFFDLWAHADSSLKVREFDEMLRGFMGLEPSLCHHRNLCDRYFTVTPSGEVYPCDCFPQTDETKLGTVFDDIELLTSANQEFFSASSFIPAACKDCSLRSSCNSGCSFHRWINAKDYSREQFYCGSYKALHAAMQPLVQPSE